MDLLYVESHADNGKRYIVISGKLEVLLQGQGLFDDIITVREVSYWLTSFLTVDWDPEQWFVTFDCLARPTDQDEITNPLDKE